MRNLRVTGQSNISISLSWEPPDQSSLQGLTYWAQCSRHGGQSEIRNTTDTSVTVDGLEPGSSYECSVWVEKDGVYSTNQTLSTTTGESRHYFLTHFSPLSQSFPLLICSEDAAHRGLEFTLLLPVLPRRLPCRCVSES